MLQFDLGSGLARLPWRKRPNRQRRFVTFEGTVETPGTGPGLSASRRRPRASPESRDIERHVESALQKTEAEQIVHEAEGVTRGVDRSDSPHCAEPLSVCMHLFAARPAVARPGSERGPLCIV